MSYTKLLYHIIFRTKYSEPSICVENEADLYRYIWRFANDKKCVLHRINGMPDHLHLLVELPAVYPVATFVRELKNASHKFIDDHKHLFPTFYAWSVGYCALTYSNSEKQKIINYIKNQKEHHKIFSFEDEIKQLLIEQEIEYSPEYFNL
ncbi:MULTISPECIES: IS200/IS605 family transposase [Glaesserella]|uniref:Transposase n=1 Tax=Glaesserella australis TaxID=2094024 RepID=A0A328BYW7_9PAST|nr:MULTISPECIES: IS200/IS605 family transposase [Glaesserella]AUI66651.1 transposase [Glaesserella sp. 15-184]RAL18825.1 transposase [Glaesserella australis]